MSSYFPGFARQRDARDAYLQQLAKNPEAIRAKLISAGVKGADTFTPQKLIQLARDQLFECYAAAKPKSRTLVSKTVEKHLTIAAKQNDVAAPHPVTHEVMLMMIATQESRLQSQCPLEQQMLNQRLQNQQGIFRKAQSFDARLRVFPPAVSLAVHRTVDELLEAGMKKAMGRHVKDLTRACAGPSCDRLGQIERLKKCTGCCAVWYCTKRCQKKAWPSHRAVCDLTFKIHNGLMRITTLSDESKLLALIAQYAI